MSEEIPSKASALEWPWGWVKAASIVVLNFCLAHGVMAQVSEQKQLLECKQPQALVFPVLDIAGLGVSSKVGAIENKSAALFQSLSHYPIPQRFSECSSAPPAIEPLCRAIVHRRSSLPGVKIDNSLVGSPHMVSPGGLGTLRALQDVNGPVVSQKFYGDFIRQAAASGRPSLGPAELSPVGERLIRRIGLDRVAAAPLMTNPYDTTPGGAILPGSGAFTLSTETGSLEPCVVKVNAKASGVRYLAQPDGFRAVGVQITNGHDVSKRGVCSFVMLSPQWAITAGHCVKPNFDQTVPEGDAEAEWKAVLGSMNEAMTSNDRGLFWLLPKPGADISNAMDCIAPKSKDTGYWNVNSTTCSFVRLKAKEVRFLLQEKQIPDLALIHWDTNVPHPKGLAFARMQLGDPVSQLVPAKEEAVKEMSQVGYGVIALASASIAARCGEGMANGGCGPQVGSHMAGLLAESKTLYRFAADLKAPEAESQPCPGDSGGAILVGQQNGWAQATKGEPLPLFAVTKTSTPRFISQKSTGEAQQSGCHLPVVSATVLAPYKQAICDIVVGDKSIAECGN